MGRFQITFYFNRYVETLIRSHAFTQTLLGQIYFSSPLEKRVCCRGPGAAAHDEWLSCKPDHYIYIEHTKMHLVIIYKALILRHKEHCEPLLHCNDIGPLSRKTIIKRPSNLKLACHLGSAHGLGLTYDLSPTCIYDGKNCVCSWEHLLLLFISYRFVKGFLAIPIFITSYC